MGIVILALFSFTALQSILPKAAREPLMRFLQFHRLWFNGAYLAFIVVFLLFGAGRALVRCVQVFQG